MCKVLSLIPQTASSPQKRVQTNVCMQTLHWSLDAEGFSESISVIIARIECAHLQLTRAKLIHLPRSPDSAICSLIEPGETFEPRLLFLTLQRIRVYWLALPECFSRDPQWQIRKNSLWNSLHIQDPQEAFPLLRAVVFAAQRPKHIFVLLLMNVLCFLIAVLTLFFPCLSWSDTISPIIVLRILFLLFLMMCMWGLGLCMCLQCPWRLEEDISSPEAGVVHSSDLLYWDA